MSRNFSLPVKIKLSFSLILVVFLLVNSLASSFFLRNTIYDLLSTNQTQILEQSVRALDEELRRMDDLALRILYQQGLKDVMERASALEGSDYFISNYMETKSTRDVLSQMIGPGSSPLRISLFNREGDYIDFGWQPVNGELIRSRFRDGTARILMDDVDTRDGGRLVRLPEQDLWYDKVAKPVVSVYREFRDLYHRYGYIHIQEPFSQLEDLLELDLPGAWFVLTDGEGRMIYPEWKDPEFEDQGRYRILSGVSE